MALILRKQADGKVVSEGDLPAEHAFPTSWLEDAIGRDIAEVTVTLKLDDGPVTYRLTGYRRIGKAQRRDSSTLLTERVD